MLNSETNGSWWRQLPFGSELPPMRKGLALPTLYYEGKFSKYLQALLAPQTLAPA
jgi:hypothetical protein